MSRIMNEKTSAFLLGVLLFLFALNLVKGGEPEYLLAVSEFAVVAAGAVWLCSMAATGKLTFTSSLANLPAILFGGALFVSTVFSKNPTSSFKGMHEAFSYLVVFFICANLPGQARRRKVAYMLIGAAAVQSIIALTQVASGIDRVSGSLTYATYLVDTLIIGLSLAGALVLFSEGAGLRRLLGQGLMVALLFVALFLTRARAGLVALAASLVVLGALKSRRWLAVLIAVVIAASVIPNPIRDRILTAGKQDIYAMERPRIWKQALRIARMRPSAGVGMRNYIYYSRMTNFPVEHAVGRYAKVAKIAHNQYLQYTATTGLAGLVTFLLFLAAVLASGTGFTKTRDPVGVGALAAIIAILAHSFVDNALYLPFNGYAFFALAGILCSTSTGRRSLKTPRRIRTYISVLGVVYALVVLRPAVSACFYSGGLRRAARNDIVGAIRPCRVALALSPSEAIYHNALAKLYAKRYDETKGVGYLYISQTRFESAIKSNPIDRVYWEDFADFIYGHKVQIGEMGALSDVCKLLQEGLKVDPFNPLLRRKLASVYVERGLYDNAARELKILLGMEPNFLLARYMLARVYGSLGNRKEEEEQYRVLREKKLQHLELKVRNEYEKKLLGFDWSLLPERSYTTERPRG